MVPFIDDYRGVYVVGPICRVLPIAPSTYDAAEARQTDPARRSNRDQRASALRDAIQQVWAANRCVYGARKVWRQLWREDGPVALLCPVERLMRQMGLQGAVRGCRPKMTAADPDQPSPADCAQRDFSSYDNALAETEIGLSKTEVIRQHDGPWPHLVAVEFAVLDWVDGFNHQRLFEPIGDMPSAEAEANFYDTIAESARVA
ncbi:Mobile element protein [Salinisphaera sp. LB1]|nr:Mobile element protein [Salinisphaera sp. LB1]